MKRPLEYIAEGFVLGEVLALLTVGWMAGILAVVMVGVYCLWKQNGRSLIWWLLPIFCVLGILWVKEDLRKEQKYDEIVSEVEGKEIEIKGILVGIQEKKDSDKLVLELDRVSLKKEGKKQPYGKVLAYMDKMDTCLRIGMTLCIQGELEGFDKPGNPGEFDYKGYYHALGIQGRFYGERLEIYGTEYWPYFDRIYRLKNYGSQILEEICEEKDRGIFEAMVLGEKSELSGEIRKLYQSSGIAHLLAISGLHISLIGLGSYRLFRKLGMGFGAAGLFGMIVTASYGVLAGGAGISASIVRAVTMAVMQMGADYLGRTYDMRTAAAVSGLILLAQSPMLLFQAGFQLSFGAVLALGGVEPLVEKWLGVKSGFWKTILAGVVIQLVTCPVIVYHYFEYPLYGSILNLIVIPLMSYVLISGICGMVLGAFQIQLGMAAIGTGHYVLEFYQWICEKVLTLPRAILVTGRPNLCNLVIYGMIWSTALAIISLKVKKATKEQEEKEKVEKKVRAGLAGVLAAGSLGLLMVRLPPNGMEITFLDVGQGDGICIHTKKLVVLVDGGSSDKKNLGEQVLEPFLKSQGICQVDYVIVSHGDQDHISGVKELLEEDKGIEICNVILPWLGKSGEDEIYEKLVTLAKEKGTKTTWMKKGDCIQAGSLRLECLYAGEEDKSGSLSNKDRNEHSLLLQVQYGLAGILLTGDMSSKGEQLWLKEGEKPQIQVLKVAHHGSSYSSDSEFLKRVDPKWAVISCGEGNRYGHPSQDTLKRLKTQGIEWFLTMDSGAIMVNTDGNKIEIRTFQNGL